jgi:hypothetical protein
MKKALMVLETPHLKSQDKIRRQAVPVVARSKHLLHSLTSLS